MITKFYRVGYYDTDEIILDSNHYNYGKSFLNHYDHFINSYFKVANKIDLPIDFLININDNLAMYGNDFVSSKIAPAIVRELVDIEKVTANPKHKNRAISIELLNEFIQSFDDDNPFQIFQEGKYIWEGYFEMVRFKLFPNLPERKASIFLFDNIEDCLYYKNINKDNFGNIYEVELIEKKELFKADMKIFDEIDLSITYNNLISELYNYWDSRTSKAPVFEYLFEGQCKLKKIK